LNQLRHVSTSVLDIAYEDSGPHDGVPTILLHGWPDDIRTWDGVLPALHASGRRTLVPYLRGFGETRFKSADTMRSGQLSALGRDVLDFADALGIERFAIVGHDWGARAAYIAAALGPRRVTHAVALSVGWGTNDPQQALPFNQARNYWYHWFFATSRGERAVRDDRRALVRFLWNTWGPSDWITDAAFEATAKSFDNPDWPDVTLHSYRHRWGFAPGDAQYSPAESALQSTPGISVPTLVIHGGADWCNDPSTSANREKFFSERYERMVLAGVGHFPSREAPDAVAQAMVRFLG